MIRRSALGIWRKREAARKAAARAKQGSTWDLLRMEREVAAEPVAINPVVIVVDADPAALEASARAIAKLMGDDLDGCR